jgi:hypothetical protein
LKSHEKRKQAPLKMLMRTTYVFVIAGTGAQFTRETSLVHRIL